MSKSNRDLIQTMTANYAGLAREEGMRDKIAFSFVIGCLSTMLQFAYDALDDIVSAYDSGAEKSLREHINRWKNDKDGIIKNNLR